MTQTPKKPPPKHGPYQRPGPGETIRKPYEER